MLMKIKRKRTKENFLTYSAYNNINYIMFLIIYINYILHIICDICHHGFHGRRKHLYIFFNLIAANFYFNYYLIKSFTMLLVFVLSICFCPTFFPFMWCSMSCHPMRLWFIEIQWERCILKTCNGKKYFGKINYKFIKI